LNPQGGTLPEDLTEETSLFGRNGILDSLSLVSLIVGVEQGIEDELGVSVVLADEKAMSQKHSPYRTIGALAEYASGLIKEQKG
jgi:acyl carrier protein